MTKRKLFYFISSVLPNASKSGGEVILHRHFEERKDFDFSIIDIPIQKPKWIKRLETTRFRSYILALQPFYTSYDIGFLSQLQKPNFIVTVAHDRQCYAAAKAAAYWNVPLVTFFHDWYPASSGAHPKLWMFLNREFIKLHRQSTLSLCVSEQMKSALGEHDNSIVLSPISSYIDINNIEQKSTEQLHHLPTILYAGLCGGAYKDMLQMVVDKVVDAKIIIAGANSSDVIAKNSNIQIFGFLQKNDLALKFIQSDILLVILNFNQHNKLHFSTHFPSKLIEYVGKGKMIAIWGPSYATAVQWAKETGAAFYYEQQDVEGLLSGIMSVYANTEQRNFFIQNATKLYHEKYNPDLIDGLLKQKLNELVC